MKTLSVWTATLVSLAIFGLTGYASPSGCPAHMPAGTIIRLFPDEKLVADVTSGPVIFTITSDVRFISQSPSAPLTWFESAQAYCGIEAGGTALGKGANAHPFDFDSHSRLLRVPHRRKNSGSRCYTVRNDVVIGRGHAGRDAFLLLFPPTTVYQLIRIPTRGPRLLIDSEMPIVIKLVEPVELGQSSDAQQAAVVPVVRWQ